jgi:hypothetical protein
LKPDFWQRFSYKSLLEKMPAWMKNRYVLTVLVFLLWIILLINNMIACAEARTRNRLLRKVLYGAHRRGPEEAQRAADQQ